MQHIFKFSETYSEANSSQSDPSPYRYFVGIDVSKKSLHIAVQVSHRIVESFELPNDKQGYRKLVIRLQKFPKIDPENTLLCMESTGIYQEPLCRFLSQQKGQLGVVWVENPYQIKHSMGLRRGKNDKADARNIAQYAARHWERCKPYEEPSAVFEQLTMLQKTREKALKIKLQIGNELRELEVMAVGQMVEIVTLKRRMTRAILEACEQTIKSCEEQMRKLVQADEEIHQQYQLLRTVEGVGLLTSVYLIVTTKNFKKFTNARKMAAHIGIAPFTQQSGTSINRKSGTSHFADKLGKKLITNAVGVAIRSYGGLREYYDKKTGEGIPPNKVLNACKNKLLHRIFAVVKSGKSYDPYYKWQPQKKAEIEGKK